VSVEVLSVERFYTALGRYMDEVDPTWAEEEFQAQASGERARLAEVLGPADGRTVLDCACGTGGQAVPLAQLGWRVTGTDATPAAIERAAARGRAAGVAVDWRVADMRSVGRLFPARFDAAIACMALDNLVDDGAIRQALGAMRDALRPGGRCYLRQRNFDTLMAVRPRYDFRLERPVPHGRVLRLEDWVYESETRVVCVWVLMREDRRKTGYQWESTALAWRRRALREAELSGLLVEAGFSDVRAVPRTSLWSPLEIVD
jgi:SAM-dependent methyltransferase